LDVPEADEQLRDILGADPPASVLALDGDSKRRQTRALEESFTATLRHVPFPVRGIVKRVLLG
jgi:hypothetical protein